MRRRISKRSWTYLAAAVLSVALFPAKGARADAPPPLSITVRGGVSLGAYEAGYLYYLTEVLKLNSRLADVKVVTGASAGTINALLVVEALRHVHPVQNPTMSMFYRAWTDDRLASRRLLDVTMDPDAVAPGTLSSGESLKGIIEMLETEWLRREPSSVGPPRPLDIVLGATATRIETHEIKKQPHFSVTRQEEKFSMRIRHEKGRFRMQNYMHGRPGYEQAFLVTDADGTVGFDRMTEILLASSAFPFAFSPVSLSLCMRKSRNPLPLICNDGDPHFAKDIQFLDGGVFDNHPLRLAYQIVESDISSDTYRNAGVEAPEPLRPEAFTFLYLDPDNTSYPKLKSHDTDCAEAQSLCGFEYRICERLRGTCAHQNGQCREATLACDSAALTCEEKNDFCEDATRHHRREAERGSKFNLLAQAGGFFGAFMGASMSKELSVLDEEHPKVLCEDRLAVTTRDFPTASGHLANFFGFFDTKLLKYDFYLGMHDARNFVQAFSSKRERPPETEIIYPEDGVTEPEAVAAWQPFHCMRAVFDGAGDGLAQCPPTVADFDASVLNAPDAPLGTPLPMQDLMILMQSSLDQLYSHCRYTLPDPSGEHLHCDRARQGSPPPFLLGPKPWGLDERVHAENWRKRAGEGNFRHMLRLLERYRFHFADLGLKRHQSENAMFQIRKDMISYVNAYSSNLTLGQKALVRTTAKPALNFAFKYAPRPHIIYFTLGKGGEVGWSGTPSLPRSLGLGIRLNAALQLQGLDTIIPPKDVTVGVSPVFGPEFEVIHPGSAWVQIRLGLRGGYQFDFRTIDEASCTDSSRTAECNAFVAQGVLALTLLEHLRLQVTGEWLVPAWPANAPKGVDFWNLLISVGWQI